MRRIKRAAVIRDEAKRIALSYARDRAACGDPEGAEEMRDIARAIGKLSVYVESVSWPT